LVPGAGEIGWHLVRKTGSNAAHGTSRHNARQTHRDMDLSTKHPSLANDTSDTAVPEPGILAEIAAGLVADDDMCALLQRFLDPIVRLAGAQAGAVRTL
jgi:hypothetical protein